jgi:hypothetical protein
MFVGHNDAKVAKSAKGRLSNQHRTTRVLTMSLQDRQSRSDPSATNWSRDTRRYLALAPGLEMDYEDPITRRPEDIFGPAAPH